MEFLSRTLTRFNGVSVILKGSIEDINFDFVNRHDIAEIIDMCLANGCTVTLIPSGKKERS